MTDLRRGLLAAALAVIVTGCGGVAAAPSPTTEPSATTEEATPRPRRTPRPTRTPQPTSVPTPAPTPTPRPEPIAGLGPVLGSDGRLTLLLLGSDARKGIPGERTDTIIVATVNPLDGRVAMVSLPRDTVNVPIAGGQVYRGRINALFGDYLSRTGKRKESLRRVKKALSYAFGTEIDYYVMVGFADVEQLVDAIGGIDVKISQTLIDRSLRTGKRGLVLRKGVRHLDGRYALAYARTRHTDSDYVRSERGQKVIAAIAARIRERGPAALPALVALASKRLETDIPFEAAPAVLALAERADLRRPKSLVLAPNAFAGPGPILYTITLKVGAVRDMFDRVFAPLR